MELLCPNCQQRLTIADQYAGQVMRCPLCDGTFTAPSLSAVGVPPPTSSPPPPPPLSPYREPTSSLPPPIPFEARLKRDTGIKAGPPPEPAVLPPEPAPFSPAPPPPPLPPGDYTRSFQLSINPRVLPWIAPSALFLVLVLTILPWIRVFEDVHSSNAWSLGFGGGDAAIGLYLILLLLSVMAAIPSALVTLRFIPAPPPIDTLGPWRLVIVGGVAGLALLFLLLRYLNVLFRATPAEIWLRLAFWVHLVAVIALLLEIWLEFRRRKSLPLPRLEVKW